jgi:cytochrome b pre-mRNA-processing protein 3
MMMFDLLKRSSWPFAKAGLKNQADNLLAAAMRGARDPAMYGPGRIADDFAGRFDAATLVATLISARLGDLGEAAQPLNQAFVNALFKSFDDALREDGVGDLTVPKKMQKIAEAFYGRAATYRSAFEHLDSCAADARASLEEALFRNVLRSAPECADFSTVLAGHVIELRNLLGTLSLEQIVSSPIEWPSFRSVAGTA